MIKIAILQPGYLPWLGFFEQVNVSDVFVIYDDVQYDKQGWRNRNRIKTGNGVQFVTVPVRCKFKECSRTNEVTIDNRTNWRKKHLFSIKQSYSSAPFYKDYIDLVEEAYSREWQYLIDIDLYFITKFVKCLGLSNKEIVRSSSLDVRGDRIERLVTLCKIFKADVFYEGAAGKNYIDSKHFEEQGIRVEFQDYKHPVYNQLYGDFVPYLSVIDLLFNLGPESLSIITNKNFMEDTG